MVAEALEAAGDDDHAQPPLALRLVTADRQHVPDEPAVGAVDELVELYERFGGRQIAFRQSPHRHADHLFRAQAHLVEALEHLGIALERAGELRELGDGHAEVGHALQVEIAVEDCQHEAEVERHRGLSREQRLDALLEREVTRVDLVVERDHLVRQLRISFAQRVHRAAERPEHELGLLLQGRLEGVQLLLERRARHRHQPNRPVT